MAYTDEELKEITEAVKYALVDDGTDTQAVTEATDISLVDNLLGHDSSGELLRITPSNIHKDIIARIQGTSENSTAMRDPFKFAGSYTTATIGNLREWLDSLHGTDYTLDNRGVYRAILNDSVIEVTSSPINYATEQYLQVVRGRVSLDSTGLLTFSNEYHIFERQYTSTDGWSAWRVAAGANTIENLNSAIENINTNAVQHDSFEVVAQEDIVEVQYNSIEGKDVSAFVIPSATDTTAGVMSAEDKNNLDIIAFRDIYKASHIDETLAEAGILLSDGTIDTISPSVPNWRTYDKVKFESGLYINPSVVIGGDYCNYVTFDGNYNVIRFGKSVSEMVLHKETTEEYVSVCVYKLDECYIGCNCSEKVNVLSENVDSLQTLVIERLEFPFQGYIDENGEFVSHILHQTTDFISCSSLEVSLHWKIAVLNSSFINFYDVDKNWIGILSNAFIEDGTFTNRIIKVPKEAYYVRVSANNEESYSGCFVPKFVPDRKKATVERNVNFVGQSIWWYDGKQLASGIGGGVIANGYQTILKEKFSFLSDTGTAYCYSGFSLGALTDDDTSSICNKMDTWAESINALWTLDTITNDFKRNIPIGDISDYNNSTGKTSYYGALRLFSDKIQELSGDDKIVIVSNALRRNSGGYTSASENTVGHTLVDYEKALLEVAVLNGWWFVDQFRLSGITDETINLTTIDGLHLNNLGYKLAVLPWVNTINILAR